jgi:hypothetical protein
MLSVRLMLGIQQYARQNGSIDQETGNERTRGIV